MSKVMKSTEFVSKLKNIANEYKTLYVMGCFGAPMTAKNKARYVKNDPYNEDPKRKAMIEAASANTFGFDCVGLIKGILWGWNGDTNKTYGGAVYASNGVPDIGANSMITVCSGVSADFSKIEVGEVVWKSGHIGVYIGDGLAVECSPAWQNKVQITAVANIGRKSGYNARTWTKHGKLPYVDYVKESVNSPINTPFTLKVGDKVKMAVGAPVYGKNKKFSNWVYKSTLYVRQIDGNRIVISIFKYGLITGAVDKKYLTKI